MWYVRSPRRWGRGHPAARIPRARAAPGLGNLPRRPGLELAGRYLPRTSGAPLGGDWYDVVAVGPERVLFTVGDVVGHGLEAAAVMRTLREAARWRAEAGDSPAEVLAHLGRLVRIDRDGRFATVLCAHLDLVTGALCVANAGHPPPLVHDGSRCALLPTLPGPPVGVGGHYATLHAVLPPQATGIAVTDGLGERRGEPLDAGLDRLRREVRADLPLDALVDHLIGALAPSPPQDDIAVLALRWHGRRF